MSNFNRRIKSKTLPENIEDASSNDERSSNINCLHGCKFFSHLNKKFNLSKNIQGPKIGPKCFLSQIIAKKGDKEEQLPFCDEEISPRRNEDNNSPGWTFNNHSSAGRKTPGFSIKAYKIGTYSEEIAKDEDQFWREERGEDEGEAILDRIFENNDEILNDSSKEKEGEFNKRRKEAETLITGIDLIKKKTPLGDIWGKKPFNSILKKREVKNNEYKNNNLNTLEHNDNGNSRFDRKVRFDKVMEVQMVKRVRKKRDFNRGNKYF